VIFVPWLLYCRGKSSQYSLNKRLGVSQSRSPVLEKRGPFPLSGIESRFVSRLAYNQVIIRIELSRTDVVKNGKNRIPTGVIGT
jgi:hypothetical protein